MIFKEKLIAYESLLNGHINLQFLHDLAQGISFALSGHLIEIFFSRELKRL
jgi:hypothetical protein